MRVRWPIVLVSVALCWSSPVLGDQGEGLHKAHEAFQQGKFDQVLQLVEPMIPVNGSRDVLKLKMFSLARLGKTGEALDVYEQLSEALGHEDEPLLRELAIHIILPLRTDMREQMRGAAYTALKEIESEEVFSFMVDGLSDGSGMIRVLVAEGLSQHQSGQSLPQLREALKDPAGLVRATVVKGFGRSGQQSRITLIRPLTEDKQEMVQVAAAGALFMLGERSQWDRIQKATEVDEGYERGSALRILGELGDPRALPILKQGVLDRQPSIRAAAAASLGDLGAPEVVPVLIPLLADPVPAVRSVAAVTLGRLKAEMAIRALTRTLHDRNEGVRAAAIAGLLQMNTPFQVVSDTVQSLVGDTNPGIRSSVAKALGNGRARDVAGLLTLILNDPIPKPRISATRSLGRVGGKREIPVLKRTLRDSDSAVKVTAAGAIARIVTAQDR